jgi:glyoxylase-like metal-dependent hydrolase (beta-lactamase superfamily II)
MHEGNHLAALHFNRDFKAPYGVAQALSARVTRILAPNPGPFTFRGSATHLVAAGGAVAVIDPGPALGPHLAALQAAIGKRAVSHILITHTHRDHCGATAALKAWCGAPVLAGPMPQRTADIPSDVPAAVMDEAHDRSFVADRIVGDGEVLAGDGFTLTCVATPGHTAGHMAYALNEESALFCGDHVMGWSTSVIAPPDGSMGAYMASLELLIVRDDVILYPTHGAPIAPPRPWLKALLEHRRAREAAILAVWRAGHHSNAAIVRQLYSRIEPALAMAAAIQVQAHLEHLAEEGLISRSDF